MVDSDFLEKVNIYMDSSRDYFIEICVQVVPQHRFRNKCMRDLFTIKHAESRQNFCKSVKTK